MSAITNSNLDFNNQEEIEYKNLHLFYKNLYSRLFNLIHLLIDEKQYNIRRLKNEVITFTDDYSYYIIGKQILYKGDFNKEKEKDNIILKRLKDHDSFTEKLNPYPSKEYTKYRKELKTYDYKIDKLGNTKYNYIVNDYYSFFDEVLTILYEFIRVAAANGFLPIMKSNKSARTIGFANYDTFFQEMENLRIKMSEITKDVNFTNLLRVRRSIYTVLIVFSSYFKRHAIKDELLNNLDFEFIKEEENTELIIKLTQYDSLDDMTTENRQKIKDIIGPLRTNISLIKRYISYEFGELDMSPKLKNKYGDDPTWT